MNWKRVLVLLPLAALLVGGAGLSPKAEARGGGGGGGRGGGGRGGAGRGGRGKGGSGGPLTRPELIQQGEAEMFAADKDGRLAAGRKASFDGIQKEKREDVFARHRRQGEDSRRQQDARSEVAR
jgi:hypothetical protein